MNQRTTIITRFWGIVKPVALSFGGGGGSGPSAPPPPAPPAPPQAKQATSSARTLLAAMTPRRTRASTVLGGGSASSNPTSRSILGSPLT